MNDINNLNPCELGDSNLASPRVNKLFNIVGVLFIATFLGYITMHCM